MMVLLESRFINSQILHIYGLAAVAAFIPFHGVLLTFLFRKKGGTKDFSNNSLIWPLSGLPNWQPSYRWKFWWEFSSALCSWCGNYIRWCLWGNLTLIRHKPDVNVQEEHLTANCFFSDDTKKLQRARPSKSNHCAMCIVSWDFWEREVFYVP